MDTALLVAGLVIFAWLCWVITIKPGQQSRQKLRDENPELLRRADRITVVTLVALAVILLVVNFTTD